ncbi:hypothetical protein [Arhodomonas sp. AD133]|uniref:hypothetical protein n=1 Tax=Arhodomonas sp. AD133 TaxID=3415009 RepID=UPI003EC14D3E
MIELDRRMIETALKMRRRLRGHGREAPPLSDPGLVPWLLEQTDAVADGELHRLAETLRARLPSTDSAEPPAPTTLRRYRGAALPQRTGSTEGAASDRYKRTTSRRVYRGRPLP